MRCGSATSISKDASPHAASRLRADISRINSTPSSIIRARPEWPDDSRHISPSNSQRCLPSFSSPTRSTRPTGAPSTRCAQPSSRARCVAVTDRNAALRRTPSSPASFGRFSSASSMPVRSSPNYCARPSPSPRSRRRAERSTRLLKLRRMCFQSTTQPSLTWCASADGERAAIGRRRTRRARTDPRTRLDGAVPMAWRAPVSCDGQPLHRPRVRAR